MEQAAQLRERHCRRVIARLGAAERIASCTKQRELTSCKAAARRSDADLAALQEQSKSGEPMFGRTFSTYASAQ